MLIITLPLIDPPKESKSGKTLLVASSNGPRRMALTINGQNVIAIVNVYIRPADYVKGVGIREQKKSVKKRRFVQKPKQAGRAKNRRR
jgi:hypothetical protein